MLVDFDFSDSIRCKICKIQTTSIGVMDLPWGVTQLQCFTNPLPVQLTTNQFAIVAEFIRNSHRICKWRELRCCVLNEFSTSVSAVAEFQSWWLDASYQNVLNCISFLSLKDFFTDLTVHLCNTEHFMRDRDQWGIYAAKPQLLTRVLCCFLTQLLVFFNFFWWGAASDNNPTKFNC